MDEEGQCDEISLMPVETGRLFRGQAEWNDFISLCREFLPSTSGSSYYAQFFSVTHSVYERNCCGCEWTAQPQVKLVQGLLGGPASFDCEVGFYRPGYQRDPQGEIVGAGRAALFARSLVGDYLSEDMLDEAIYAAEQTFAEFLNFLDAGGFVLGGTAEREFVGWLKKIGDFRHDRLAGRIGRFVGC